MNTQIYALAFITAKHWYSNTIKELLDNDTTSGKGEWIEKDTRRFQHLIQDKTREKEDRETQIIDTLHLSIGSVQFQDIICSTFKE